MGLNPGRDAGRGSREGMAVGMGLNPGRGWDSMLRGDRAGSREGTGLDAGRGQGWILGGGVWIVEGDGAGSWEGMGLDRGRGWGWMGDRAGFLEGRGLGGCTQNKKLYSSGPGLAMRDYHGSVCHQLFTTCQAHFEPHPH